jgi:hypothetical protein
MQQYVSPFRNLGIDLSQEVDKNALNRAKKTLLAELDLSQNGTILRGSMEMSKDDIIKQFDKLNSIKHWDFHRLVLADNALLNFVQNKEWNAKTALLKEPKYDTPAFIEFISPYFSESYKSLIIKSLAHNSYANLSGVLNIKPRMMTEEDRENVWFSVESFLDVWKTNLDEIAENLRYGQEYADKELLPFHSKSFMQCLNLLPEEFSWFRDDYATSLFNLSAYSWNKQRHYRAMELVKNARFLHLSEDTITMLDERIAWFDAEMKDVGTADSSFDWSTAGRIILFIIFFLVRLATCDSSSSSSSVTYTPSDFSVPTVASSPLNDSLMERSVRNTLEKEGIISKKWDISRFYALLNAIKKSETNRETKLNQTLIVDKCLQELNALQDSNNRTMTFEQINDLIKEFKVLRVQRGLE